MLENIVKLILFFVFHWAFMQDINGLLIDYSVAKKVHWQISLKRLIVAGQHYYF